MKQVLRMLNSDTSELIYGLIEQAFAYFRNMAVLAGIATVTNMVSSHPGLFFRLNFSDPVLLLFSAILGVLILGSSALFAHKSRVLLAARVGGAWSARANRTYMWSVTWVLLMGGAYFIIEALTVLRMLSHR